ncbi:MAG: radical SAM protein [Lachnospiraceae bacterium]|nr:radical SAM protein [Lachnospiraceae bacterium]
MSDCVLCPRMCHVNRLAGKTGFCGQGAQVTAARAALHFWEEPCICGSRGSGAVFFSGCNLRCVFCQNHDIALGKYGRPLSLERLSQIFLELQDKGAVNINLVTAGHFLPQVCLALQMAKSAGLCIPVVYNSSGYETADSLRILTGLVDIYLPDLKYHSPRLSALYSHAPDYFEMASAAIAEMFRQVGKPVLSPDSGLMEKGVIVRHLLLPGCAGDSKRVLRYLHDTYGNDIYVSIMNQYTPLEHLRQVPDLDQSPLLRPVTAEEYARILDFADRIGIENGYMQEGGTAAESFIPAFDGEGLSPPVSSP